MTGLCVICDEPIPLSKSGMNSQGRVRCCCQDHSKLLDKHHGDVDMARAEYQRDLEQNRLIDSFIYARRENDLG